MRARAPTTELNYGEEKDNKKHHAKMWLVL